MPSELRQSLSFDVASAISCGARDYQEDAMVSDFANGDTLGFVILSDGMGGHAAGDVASKIVVTEMFRALTFEREQLVANAAVVCETLRAAANGANACLEKHVKSNPQTNGMGATLITAVVADGLLYWVSVGDSPLFLFRDGTLVQLNEDHSMAGQIDLMVEKGMLSKEDAQAHPDRNVLTSVLIGAPISQIDCPTEPFELRAGDTVIVASDGLQFLTDEAISRVLRDLPLSRSKEIAEVLMAQLMMLDDPDLDNVSLQVLQVGNARQDSFVMAAHDISRHEVAAANAPVPDGIIRPAVGVAAKGLNLFSRKVQG